MGNDIKYMPEKLEQASNFANKIWNAAKFVTMNLADGKDVLEFKKQNYDSKTGEYKKDSLKLADMWIINKLDKLILSVTQNIENYDLGIALDNIYDFMWNEFCDWYIEIAKIRLYNGNKEEKIQTSYVLNEIFINCLKLLHPFMPFITSKIYDNLIKEKDEELMLSKWPEVKNKDKFEKQEIVFEKIKELIVGIRNVRAEMNIHPSKKTQLIIVTSRYEKEIKQANGILLKLGFANKAIIQKDKTGIPNNAISILTDGISIYIPQEGLIDIEEEKKRIQEKRAKLEAEIARSEKILSNKGFLAKAPEEKIKEEKEKYEKYKYMLQQLGHGDGPKIINSLDNK